MIEGIAYRESNGRRRALARRPATRTGGLTMMTAAALAAIVLAAGGGVWWWMSRGDSSQDANILLHTVARDDFELKITERGEVEAFDVTEIRSLVKSNNTSGTAILKIVPRSTGRPASMSRQPAQAVCASPDRELARQIRVAAPAS